MKFQRRAVKIFRLLFALWRWRSNLCKISDFTADLMPSLWFHRGLSSPHLPGLILQLFLLSAHLMFQTPPGPKSEKLFLHNNAQSLDSVHISWELAVQSHDLRCGHIVPKTAVHRFSSHHKKRDGHSRKSPSSPCSPKSPTELLIFNLNHLGGSSSPLAAGVTRCYSVLLSSSFTRSTRLGLFHSLLQCWLSVCLPSSRCEINGWVRIWPGRCMYCCARD